MEAQYTSLRIGIFLLIGSLLTAEVVGEPTQLPTWIGTAGSDYVPGGGLWPEGTLPIGAAAVFAKASHPPHAELIRDSEADGLPEIKGAVRDQFFNEKPVDFLIDPQRLITEQKANDVLRFLELHADGSRYQIYSLVLGEEQLIPEDINLEELHRKWFGAEHAVLLTYHLNDPEQCQLIFSKEDRLLMPQELQGRIKESSLAKAKGSSTGHDQLERIIIELSIQLFGAEQLMKRPTIQETAPQPAPKPPIAVEKPAEKMPVAVPAPAAEITSFYTTGKAKLDSNQSRSRLGYRQLCGAFSGHLAISKITFRPPKSVPKPAHPLPKLRSRAAAWR